MKLVLNFSVLICRLIAYINIYICVYFINYKIINKNEAIIYYYVSTIYYHCLLTMAKQFSLQVLTHYILSQLQKLLWKPTLVFQEINGSY